MSPLPVMRQTIFTSCFETKGGNNNAHNSVVPFVVPRTSSKPCGVDVTGEGGWQYGAPRITGCLVATCCCLEGEDGAREHAVNKTTNPQVSNKNLAKEYVRGFIASPPFPIKGRALGPMQEKSSRDSKREELERVLALKAATILILE